jgi:hypothetical protein
MVLPVPDSLGDAARGGTVKRLYIPVAKGPRWARRRFITWWLILIASAFMVGYLLELLS